MDVSKIDNVALAYLTCEDCMYAGATMVVDQVYCKLRKDHVPVARPICKKFAKGAPKPVAKKPDLLKPSTPEVVEVPGRYVYIGRDLIGRVIGQLGRNIQCLEEVTASTIEIHDSFVWVGSVDMHKQDVACAYLYALSSQKLVYIQIPSA